MSNTTSRTQNGEVAGEFGWFKLVGTVWSVWPGRGGIAWGRPISPSAINVSLSE